MLATTTITAHDLRKFFSEQLSIFNRDTCFGRNLISNEDKLRGYLFEALSCTFSGGSNPQSLTSAEQEAFTARIKDLQKPGADRNLGQRLALVPANLTDREKQALELRAKYGLSKGELKLAA